MSEKRTNTQRPHRHLRGCVESSTFALVLLAVLLALRLHPQLHRGKGNLQHLQGMISPEFIISAFCLTILVIRPNVPQALVIGLISAAVIRIAHHLALC